MQNPAQKGVPDRPPMTIRDEDIESKRPSMTIRDEDIEWLPSGTSPSSDVEVPISVEEPSSEIPSTVYPEEAMPTVKIKTSPKDERGYDEASETHDAFAQTVRRPPLIASDETSGVKVFASPQRVIPSEPRGFLPEEEGAPESGGLVDIGTSPKESDRFRGMAFNQEEGEAGEIPVSVDLSQMPQSAPVQSGVRPKGASSADVIPLSEGEEEESGKKWEISGRALAEQSADSQREYQRKNISPYAPSVLYPDGEEEGKDRKPESGVDGGREAA